MLTERFAGKEERDHFDIHGRAVMQETSRQS
jgi:hypothetical protein